MWLSSSFDQEPVNIHDVLDRARRSAMVGFARQEAGSAPAAATGGVPPRVLDADRRPSMEQLLSRRPWNSALHYLVGAVAFALVFAGAAHVAYPHRLGIDQRIHRHSVCRDHPVRS